MIILLIKLIIITSILVLGWTAASQEGMVFYPIRQWAEKKNEEGLKIMQPLFLCVWCQSSIWSLMGYAFAYGLGIIEHFKWEWILLYLLTVAGSSLLNGIVWGVHRLIEATTAKNDAAERYYDNVEKLAYMDIKDRKEAFKKRTGNGKS